jgi:hypothetical protein
MKISNVLICEVKRLLGPGASLKNLAEASNLEISKGIFPFSCFTSLSFLDRTALPPDASSWANNLNPAASPSQQQVDEAIDFFNSQHFSTISDYLEWYLDKDVEILQRCVIAISEVYYSILGLNVLECGRLTVSSLASLGAQTFLSRHCRPAFFSCNHQRMYAILRRSLLGGLSAVSRTVAGEHCDLRSYVALLERQMERGGDDGGPDLELCERVEASGLSKEDYISNCNAHLLPPGTAKNPAVASVYLDVNS